MTKLEQLKATLAAKTEEAKVVRQEKIEVARIQAKLNMLENAGLQDAIVLANLSQENSTKVNDLIEQCKEIITSMPIYNNRTRENRKWNGRREYGMGTQIAAISELLSGIQYSAAEHKQLMLVATGLNEELIEDTLAAFGSTAYYSAQYGSQPESLYDIDALQTRLMLIESTLDVTLNKSQVTPAVMRNRFEMARAKAEMAEAQAELADMTKTVDV